MVEVQLFHPIGGQEVTICHEVKGLLEEAAGSIKRKVEAYSGQGYILPTEA